MRYDGLLNQLVDTYHGMLTSRMMDEHGIPRRELVHLVQDGILIKKDRGLYVVKGYTEDPFIYGAYHYSKGVYDLDAAMSIHGFTNVSLPLAMAFPQGTNTTQIHNPWIKPFTVNPLRYKNGVRKKRTPLKTYMCTYDLPTTLIHLIMRKNDIDPSKIKRWFNQYLSVYPSDELYRISKLLRCESKLIHYLSQIQDHQ